MRRLACILWAVVCPALPSSAQEPPELRHASAAYGFSILRPSADWLVSESEAGGKYTLTLTHRKAAKLVTARVIVQPAPGTSPVDVRDRTVSSVAGNADFRVGRVYTDRLAGGEAPAVEIQQRSGGRWFQVRQAYVAADGRLFTLTCYAPADTFAQVDAAFRAIWKGFRLAAADPLSETGLRRTAARLGGDFAWETEWPAAAKRAAAERKLVFVAVSKQSGFQVADRIRTSILADPDVAALVRRRFVLLQYRTGMRAPWTAMGGTYGISPRGFGTTVLVVTPDGTYAGDLQAVHPTLIDRFLRRICARHPEAAGAVRRPRDGDRTAAAWEALARGELEAALQALGDAAGAEAHRIRSAVARRRFDGAAALAAIDQAVAAAPAGSALRLEARIERALVQARMADWKGAGETALACVREQPAHPRIPEALYYLGHAQIRLGGVAAATATWRRLVRDHTDTVWAWRAAEGLLNPYLQRGSARRFHWPERTVRDLLGRLQREGPEHTESAERDAVAYLVRTQRDDGSWASTMESTSPLDTHYSPLTIAKTAICATSLLAYRDGPEVRRALDRATAFLLGYRTLLKSAPAAPPILMDYRPWARAYELAFYAEAAVAGVGDPAAVQAAMGEVLADLHGMQKPGGGWSYYVSTDPKQPRAQNQSISFVTAACTHAVLDAQAAGAELPAGLLPKALTCLEQMRNPTGHFEYFLWHDRAPRTPVTALDLGAVGRGPVCTLALHRAGRASAEQLERAVEAFLQHKALYAREQGKSLMHCGPDGQGCHYLLFDYLYTARSVRRLPAEARPPLRRQLAQLIHAARYAGGAYEDTPLGGRHSGTGLALLAVRALVPERK